MKITLLCSCGLLLEQDGHRMLIDAPNEELPPFYGIPRETVETFARGEGVFSHLDGLIFTHLHPDHYDEKPVRVYLSGHPTTTLLPDFPDPERMELTAGAFRIEAHRFPHMPAGGFEHIAHDVLLITAGGKTVYVTADALADPERHRLILNGRTVDAAFWNSRSLSYPEMRSLFRDCAKQNFIYHMPADPIDRSGIRRKAQRNLERYPNELLNVRVLLDYPSELTI